MVSNHCFVFSVCFTFFFHFVFSLVALFDEQQTVMTKQFSRVSLDMIPTKEEVRQWLEARHAKSGEKCQNVIFDEETASFDSESETAINRVERFKPTVNMKAIRATIRRIQKNQRRKIITKEMTRRVYSDQTMTKTIDALEKMDDDSSCNSDCNSWKSDTEDDEK